MVRVDDPMEHVEYVFMGPFLTTTFDVLPKLFVEFNGIVVIGVLPRSALKSLVFPEVHALQIVVIGLAVPKDGFFGGIKEMLVQPADDGVFVGTAFGEVDADQYAVPGNILGQHVFKEPIDEGAL